MAKPKNRPMDIHAVLLLAKGEQSSELAQVVWPALAEVEQFYGPKRLHLMRTIFTSANLTLPLEPKPPTGSIVPVNVPTPWTAVTESPRVSVAELAKLIHPLLKGPGKNKKLVVVTDLELIPPKDWSYVIWSDDEWKEWETIALGIPPTDPHYWGTRDPDRLATIKHRVRTGVLSIAGELLGLVRCTNERCFLFVDVDSASTLDSMMSLGEEHGLDDLEGCGFKRETKLAAKVQEVENLEKLTSAGEVRYR